MRFSYKIQLAVSFLVVVLGLILVILLGPFRMKSLSHEAAVASSARSALGQSTENIISCLDHENDFLSDRIRKQNTQGSATEITMGRDFQQYSEQCAAELGNCEKALATLLELAGSPDEKEKLQFAQSRMAEAQQAYQTYLKGVQPVLRHDQERNALPDLDMMKKSKMSTIGKLRQVNFSVDEFIQQFIFGIRKRTADAMQLTIFVAFITIVLGAGLVWIIMRNLSKSMADSVSIIQKIAESDYDSVVPNSQKGGLNELTPALQQLTEMMKAKEEMLDKMVYDAQTEKTNIEEKIANVVVEVDQQKQYLERSVGKILFEMEKFATGDLTVNLFHDKNDEIGKLFKGFNDAVINIREMVKQAVQHIISVADEVAQIGAATEELAATSQQESLQTTDVASAVEEMTRTIIENSRNAASTLETAREEKSSAEHGREVVERTVEIMKNVADVVNQSAATVTKLGQSSDQIGAIISVIDDIADQTNLLALNASIEAARAGEQGRGFAVVAEEVRKLADKTVSATKEVAAMIEKIQAETKSAVVSMQKGTERVKEGITFVSQADSVLQDIVKKSAAVTDKVTQIAVVSEEQSATSEEISRNVEAISTATQESASATQQIAQTMENLSRLIEEMQKTFSRFKLSGEAQRTADEQSSFTKFDIVEDVSAN